METINSCVPSSIGFFAMGVFTPIIARFLWGMLIVAIQEEITQRNNPEPSE